MSIKNSLIYSVNSIISATIPFFMMPILTRYLSPEAYGQVAMYNLLVAGLFSLTSLSCHGLILREYFEGYTSKEYSRLVGNALLLVLLCVLIVSLLLFIFNDLIASILNVDDKWLFYAIISSYCSFVINVRLSIYQAKSKPFKYGVVQIVQSIFNVFLGLYFVISLELDAEGRVLSIVFALVVVAILSFLSLVKNKEVSFFLDFRFLKKFIIFGGPLIPHVFGGFLLFTIDRFVVQTKLGIEAVGIYMVAITFSNGMNLILNSVNKAFTPWLFSYLSKQNADLRVLFKYKIYLLIVFVSITVFSFLISDSIVGVLAGDDFSTAGDVLPFLVLGQCLFGMYLSIVNYIIYTKQTIYLSYITISSSIFNIISLYILLPYYGLIGAGYAFAMSNLLRFFITLFVLNKLINSKILNFGNYNEKF
ncbi:hypothetical protein D8S93_09320 [Vibrio sp. VGrn 2]|uniref:oligosaccharide flippase family protein n=1 Tax=Vibrio sp. VGrn 2 TaxID=2419839 RepID=UPI00128BBA35|nr:oligosaccharide flippase family protein [Vibrio sp. VGrn 2]MPS38832.1 hypothetical protein [Vibrio sp. VGrn 2]